MEKDKISKSAHLRWVFFFCLVAIGFISIAVFYYRYEAQRIQDNKYEDLSAIAKLKTDSIQDWRRNRLADVRRVPGPLVKKEIARLLQDPTNSSARAALQIQLNINRKGTVYADALFLDIKGNILLSDNPVPAPVDQATMKAIEAALKDRREVLSDFFDPKGRVYIDAVAPIPDSSGRPIAIVVLRSNAADFLYPLIQAWPTPSRTAETLLLCRDGDSILFLNELRHRSNTALTLRFPLTDTHLPGVQAILGKYGRFRGRDYRGIDVLATLQPIPQSPWFLVAKVDADEILAEVKYRAGGITIIVILLILIAAGLISSMYRKRAKEELRKSEAQLLAILDATPFPIALVDVQDNKIDFWSHSALTLFGHTAPTAAEWYQIAYPDPDYQREVIDRWKPFLEIARESHQTVNTGEYRVTCSDGSSRICELYVTFLTDRLMVTFNDITDRKQAEEMRRESEEKFLKAFQTSPYAITITRAEDGGFIEVNDAFTLIAGYTREEALTDSSVGLKLWANEEDRESVVADLRAGRAVEGREYQFRTKSGKNITGLFSAQIIKLSSGPRILSSINNITERKQAEEALSSSKEFLNSVIEQTPESLWVSDSEGTMIRMNLACHKLFRVTEEEAVGKYNLFKDNLIEEQGFMPLVEDVFRKGEIARFTIDYDLPRVKHIKVSRAKHRIIDVIISPIKDLSGKVTNAIILHKDITERKRAEDGLSIASLYARSLIEASLDPLVTISADGRIMDVNKTTEQVTGVSREKLIGSDFSDYFTEPDKAREGYKQVFTQGFVNDYPLTIRHSSGHTTDVLYNASVYKNEAGEVQGVFAAARDITERKRTEAALLHASERLSLALHAGGIGIWELDLVNNNLIWDEQMFHLYGIAPDQFGGTYEAWRAGVHPEDLQQGEAELQMALRGEKEFDTEFRVVWPDGTIRNIHSRASVHRDASGQPTNMIGTNYDITNRKRAEEALQESENRLSTIFKNDPTGIFIVNGKTRIIYDVNDSALEIIGLPRGDVVGKVCHRFLCPAETGCCPICDLGQLVDRSERVLLKPDGTRVPILKSVVPITLKGENYLLESFIDITERKQAEEELRRHREHLEVMVAERTADLGKAEEKFRTMADFTYDWEYWLDADRRVLYVSPSCERITGFPPASFYEDPLFIDTIIHPDDRQIFDKHIGLYHTGNNTSELCEMEFRIIDRNGCTKWIGHVCTPVTGDNGVFLGRRASNRDITERKHAEVELKRQAVQLEVAYKELDAFSHSVSHDLRAPLRGIDGWSLALLEDYGERLDDQARKYLNLLRTETQQMGRLIDDMLKLSRVTRAELQFVPIDLTAMARSIATRLQEERPDRRIEFIIQPALKANGDSHLLDIALFNLFENAVKFTGTRSHARIEFGEAEVDGGKAFFVRDNGVGFDMAFADKLFGAFQRLHKSSEFPGNGIGLATVQRVIHRHGGRIWADAQVDKGATFYFTLTLKETI